MLEAGVGDAGAVLKVDVVDAFPEERLGIVDPTRRREEVIAGAMRVGGRRG
jgi:hypothetical protein